MPATQVKDTISAVRDFLVEKKAKYWSDAELKHIYQLGVNDLWGAILDLHANHYIAIAGENRNPPVVLKANQTEISGVPEDCFRVLGIEPLDTTAGGSGRGILFTPKKYMHPDFVVARTQSAQDTGGAHEIYYDVSGVGAPIRAPRIYTAPKLNADLTLRLVYNPSIEVADENPIPGQSDNALEAWVKAYAMAKEGSQGQRVPDPGWLQIYGTEKQLILTRLTPRQEQEPDVVDSVFQNYGHM